MPRDISETLDGVSSADDDEIPYTSAKEDVATKQLNGKLEDNGEEVEEKPKQKKEAEAKAEAAEEGSDEGLEDGEEVYTVEAVQKHVWKRGKLLYMVKWENFPESENTFEPEENLLPYSAEALAEYHRSIGGPPQRPSAVKNRKSAVFLKESASAPATNDSSPAPSQIRKRRRESTGREQFDDWLPEDEIWDSHISEIETIGKDDDDNGKLIAFVAWKNGKRTKVNIDMIYKHCPQPMLKFYESHLKFT